MGIFDDLILFLQMHFEKICTKTKIKHPCTVETTILKFNWNIFTFISRHFEKISINSNGRSQTKLNKVLFTSNPRASLFTFSIDAIIIVLKKLTLFRIWVFGCMNCEPLKTEFPFTAHSNHFNSIMTNGMFHSFTIGFIFCWHHCEKYRNITIL